MSAPSIATEISNRRGGRGWHWWIISNELHRFLLKWLLWKYHPMVSFSTHCGCCGTLLQNRKCHGRSFRWWHESKKSNYISNDQSKELMQKWMAIIVHDGERQEEMQFIYGIQQHLYVVCTLLDWWSCSVFLCCRDLLTYYSLGDQVHFDVFLNRLTYDVTS